MENNKQKTIKNIEQLFPIDSEFEATNKLGEKLLIETIKKLNWRNLPIDFLIKYSEKCENELFKQ